MPCKGVKISCYNIITPIINGCSILNVYVVCLWSVHVGDFQHLCAVLCEEKKSPPEVEIS